MPSFHFVEARACVLEKVSESRPRRGTEPAPLDKAAGRILAEEIQADRDYPAVSRSVRDGFAVRSSDLPGELEVIGEVRAGETFVGEIGPGQAVEIMTGAPIPRGADAVVMIEHVSRSGNRIRAERASEPGEFISHRGCEARGGEVVLRPGKRLGFAEIAFAASAGKTSLRVYTQPEVAILATGDEIIEPHETPLAYQIRNSNVYSLAAQVARAGGTARILPIARDRYDHTRALIEQGLNSDLLLLSGGVSAGKYDIVETVLADVGAEFFFDRVLIQPGQPLVFGRAREKFFFGLPGNPASTMVTFEIFARAALELIAGQGSISLPLTLARLTTDFRHQTGLTRFLPACLSPEGDEVTPIKWQGSGDIPALTRANAFLMADPDREQWRSGELIRVLLK